MKYSDQPHRRYNPLTNEWVLVSPHRAKRPWQGKVEPTAVEKRPAYDQNCYLCPGNTRVSGQKNPDYETTFVFVNDHQAMLPEGESIEYGQDSLFRSQSVVGEARVICFSPDHSQTLADMSETQIISVIDTWAEQLTELSQRYQWVQIFENKGEIMGCSSPHPHGQIWASQHLPTEILKEQACQSQYFEARQRPLLLDYVEREQQFAERIVCQNQDWIVVVPYWACWPFETLLLPTFTISRLNELTQQKRQKLAQILSCLLKKYDALFDVSFPYTMGWHGAPNDGKLSSHWQLHAHFYPPLLRSSTVKKFMVGYEMLAEVQRDLTPEQAAQRLAAL